MKVVNRFVLPCSPAIIRRGVYQFILSMVRVSLESAVVHAWKVPFCHFRYSTFIKVYSSFSKGVSSPSGFKGSISLEEEEQLNVNCISPTKDKKRKYLYIICFLILLSATAHYYLTIVFVISRIFRILYLRFTG